MLVKALVLGLVAAGVLRLLFGSRISKLTKLAGQLLDTTLIVIGLVLVIQLVLIAIK